MATQFLLAVAVAFCLLASSGAQIDDERNRFFLYNLNNPSYVNPGKLNQYIRAPNGIPLGDLHTEQNIFIWRTGMVTLGLDSKFSNFSTPTRNLSQASYMVAPLWFSNVSQHLVNSNVSWEEHTEDQSFILEFASNAVGTYTQDSFGKMVEFMPKWALVVNWNVSLSPENATEVCNNFNVIQCEAGVPRDQCDRDKKFLGLLCDPGVDDLDESLFLGVTFQLVLATDWKNTYAIYLYGCNEAFRFNFNPYNILYNDTTIGYRVGNNYESSTCVNHVPDLLRCNDLILECDNIFDPPGYSYDFVDGILYNLTNTFSEFQFDEVLEEGKGYLPFQLVDMLPDGEGNSDYGEDGSDYGEGSSDYDEGSSDYIFKNSSGEPTVGVKSLSRYYYAVSDPIFYNIRVGNTTQTSIYVGTNGIISFGRRFYFSYPERFPSRYPWIRDTYVAAPFWHDVDISISGDILYTVLNDTTLDVFNKVDTFIKYQKDPDFKAEWMLIAFWNEVPVYPHSWVVRYPQFYSAGFRDTILNNNNTFEAIIVSSGTDTYAIYTYNCEYLTNPGAYRNAVIGYNMGGLTSENNVFSGSSVAHRVACQHLPLYNWFNVVYKLNTGKDEKLEAMKECRKLVAEDKMAYDEYLIEDYVTGLAESDPCPCNFRNAWRDRRFRWDNNNFYCFYPRFATYTDSNFDQYCCYATTSPTWGALLTSGYRASGLARLTTSYNGIRSLTAQDRTLRDVCCGLADLCNLYIERRPINNCTGYIAPTWTWGWGDPHLTTLDGYSYTFNGYGEYVLARIAETGKPVMELQGRTVPIPGDNKATQWSAFAIGYFGGTIVEVNCNASWPFCTVLLNSDDISSNLTSINDTYSFGNVNILRESETTVEVVFQSGITLAVTYSGATPSFQLTLPKLSNPTSGLLGNNDDNAFNDLVYRNGSQLYNATEQQIFEFGNSWVIQQANESFFTYADGKGPVDSYYPQWTPNFSSDILATASDEIKQMCTPEGASEPVEQCVFDAEATGDLNIGIATLDTLIENELAKLESTNMPPVLNISTNYIRVNLSYPASLDISVRDDNDTVPVLLTNPPAGSTLTLGGAPDQFIFTWALTGLGEEEEVLPLTFYATDSLGAVATITPRLEICACQNGGNCTLEGVANTAAEVVIANCICPPAWNGRYCQWDVDGCLEIACLPGVDCTDVEAPGEGAECGPCPAGYSGDGIKCLDLDECTRDTDSCEQTCTNTEGSFVCSCRPGYQVDVANPYSCSDIDECSLQQSGCAQICVNTEGSYNCTCWDGFDLEDDRQSCRPETVCSSSPCDTTAVCANINNNDTCYCERGYTLDASRTSCLDIDECEEDLLVCQSVCTNFEGTFVCSCNPGYELGPDASSCTDVDECQVADLRGFFLCEGDDVCVNTEGDYRCICSPGTYLVATTTSNGVCASPAVQDEFLEHSIMAAFTMFSVVDLLEKGGIEDFADLLVQAVGEKHCRENSCRIKVAADAGSRSSRNVETYDPEVHSVQAIFDLQNVASGESVSIPFYMEVWKLGNLVGVLYGDDTLAAVQASQSDFEAVFGTLVFSLANPPPTDLSTEPPEEDDDDFSTAVVAGIAAGVAVGAVLLAVTLAAVLYLIVVKRSKSKDSGRDKRELLTQGVSWPDGKKGEGNEMKGVASTAPVPEDPGQTVVINTEAT